MRTIADVERSQRRWMALSVLIAVSVSIFALVEPTAVHGWAAGMVEMSALAQVFQWRKTYRMIAWETAGPPPLPPDVAWAVESSESASLAGPAEEETWWEGLVKCRSCGRVIQWADVDPAGDNVLLPEACPGCGADQAPPVPDGEAP